jgi:hypothetical protein
VDWPLIKKYPANCSHENFKNSAMITAVVIVIRFISSAIDDKTTPPQIVNIYDFLLADDALRDKFVDHISQKLTRDDEICIGFRFYWANGRIYCTKFGFQHGR